MFRSCVWRAALALSSFMALAGCLDEKVVFRDRELFEDPPTAAAKFIGYTDAETKLTVCGNCHVSPQGQWEGTAHAGAWAGLQASGHAQPTCEACHSVNELGNSVTGQAGHSATGDARYQDVQCEACHGPGLDHVTDPADETIPLASLSVGASLTSGCGECHQGSHHPFMEDWAASGHGRVQASPAGRAECVSCHTGEDALKAWGIRGDYVEKAGLDAPGAHMPITCGVCHDPHGSDNNAQLRFPVDVPNEEQNLCMKCHHKRGVPDPTSTRGPHSPQGPTLLGEGGWWPPNLEFDGPIVATHGSQANPRLCASCHVRAYSVLDAKTGQTVFATGHSFEATPCLGAGGAPVGGTCPDAEKSYAGCTAAGCHGTEAVARSIRFVAETRLEELAAELDALVQQVPASEFSATDNRYTVGEGSKFNVELARMTGQAVHNPFLLEALLIGSIREIERTYPFTPTSGVSLERVLGNR